MDIDEKHREEAKSIVKSLLDGQVNSKTPRATMILRDNMNKIEEQPDLREALLQEYFLEECNMLIAQSITDGQLRRIRISVRRHVMMALLKFDDSDRFSCIIPVVVWTSHHAVEDEQDYARKVIEKFTLVLPSYAYKRRQKGVTSRIPKDQPFLIKVTSTDNHVEDGNSSTYCRHRS